MCSKMYRAKIKGHSFIIYCVVLLVFLHNWCFGELSFDSTEHIRQSIKHIRDDVLGVSTFQQHISDSANFQTVSLDSRTIVTDVADSISVKFRDRADAVLRLQKEIRAGYVAKSWKLWNKCCEIPEPGPSDLKVNHGTLCSIESLTASKKDQTPTNNFLRAAQRNKDLHPGLKWQYFGSEFGVFTQFPASHISSCNSSYDNRYRPWYVQASTPKPKDVIIAIDVSGSMIINNRIGAAIDAATTVLNTLSPNDRVTVITFSDDAKSLGAVHCMKASAQPTRSSLCFNNMMASATPHNIHHLVGLVKQIKPHGDTYYVTALKLSFDFLESAYKWDLINSSNSFTKDKVAKSRDRVILFLSDGVPSDSPFRIFKLIKLRNLAMQNSVVLLCYELGKGTFGPALKLMASQNFTFHGLKINPSICEECDPPVPGVFHKVVETKHLRSAMGSYYSFFSHHKNNVASTGDSVVWSVPYFDAGGLGMVMTAASTVIIDGTLVGVVGVDLTMHELVADVTYFSIGANIGYAFLLSLDGKVLMHPLLPAPSAVSDDTVITGIEAFERSPEVLKFLHSILNDVSNNKVEGSGGVDEVYYGVFNMTHMLPTGHKDVMLHNVISSLSCSIVKKTKFILCVVMGVNVTSFTDLAPQQVPPDFTFLYHRFDLVPPSGHSIVSTQMITPNKSSVVFAPSAFVDSGSYLEYPESTATMQSYQHFILTGDYFGSPATQLKSSIRSNVLVSWVLDKIWMQSTFNHPDKHIIWRYFASESGMFRILPGVQMNKLYEPTHRPWYDLAIGLLMEEYNNHNFVFNPDDMLAAISPPYTDASTGNIIVTISRAIVEPILNHSHNMNHLPHVLGVMGADISLRYFESLLFQAVPECSSGAGYCIVVDTSGYVIYDHPLVSMEVNAVELARNSNYHLIHGHPNVASILINKKILVRQQCIDVAALAFRESYLINRSHIAESSGGLHFGVPSKTLHFYTA
nr:VWFA and cache domain-containing protein 1-like [Ciona intestinalis]|eukprot:XP_026692576.1 VWFA and cache domain-containing protein 1-like [Ciona intestinalis]